MLNVFVPKTGWFACDKLGNFDVAYYSIAFATATAIADNLLLMYWQYSDTGVENEAVVSYVCQVIKWWYTLRNSYHSRQLTTAARVEISKKMTTPTIYDYNFQYYSALWL